MRKALLVVLAISLMLRLAPVILYSAPMSYDAPFHMRHAQMILEQGSIPAIDTAANVPNIYPPLYHLLLAGLHLLSGISLELLASYILPIISALVPLGLFIYIRRISTARNAVVAATLAAIASPLVAAAYDSPENIAFLALPLALLLLHSKRNVVAGLLCASMLLWNYFFVIVIAIPVSVAYRRRAAFIASAWGGAALVLAFSLATKGFGFFQSQTLAAGMGFIVGNLGAAMPVLVFATLVGALPCFLLALAQKQRPEKEAAEHRLFAVLWLAISVAALLSFVAGPLLRPWEHVKFACFAGILLIAPLSNSAWRSRFLAFLAALLLITSVLLSFQVVFPKVMPVEGNAFAFLEGKNPQGAVLAEPAMSEWLRMRTGLDEKLITSLYFEGGENKPLGDALLWLQGKGSADFLLQNSVSHVVLNFEDKALRGTDWLKGMEGLDKVYLLAYNINCPFPWIPKSVAYACGEDETAVFEFEA